MLRLLALGVSFCVAVAGCGGSAPEVLVEPDGDAAPDAQAVTPPEAGALPVPLAVLSAEGLDFGLVDCGGSAPAPQSVTLRNLGTAPLTWNASLGASDVFQLVDPTRGTIAVGGSATVTVSAGAIAASARAGATSQALLTLSTNDVLHAKSDLVVKSTAGGGAILLSPATAAFGQVPLNAQAADLPLTVTNVGNAPVAVAFGQPANTQFALGYTGAPSAITLAPGASVPGLVARFKPAVTPAASSTASIYTTGVVCGSVPTLKLTGQGTVGTVSVTPAEVFFGQVACNTTGTTQKVRVANNGVGSFQFNAALALGSGSPYTLTPPSGTVSANGFVDIDVVPKAIPQTSLTTDDLYADTLTVTTLGIPGDPPHTILLHETARGARVASSAASVAFGDVPLMTSRSSPITLTNSGNAPITLTLATGGAPYAVFPGAPSILTSGGGTLPASVTFAPQVTGNQAGSVSFTPGAGTVLCAPLPPPVALAGRGTNGQVSVSAATLDFALVSCGASAAAQSFTITNSGTATFTWTGALTRGASSPYTFTVSPAGGGTLNPTETATVTVTPRAVPSTSLTTAGLYDDTLTISSSVVGDPGTPIQLRETARGAILAFAPSSIAFGNLPVTQTADRAFQLANSGNAAATVTLNSTNGHFSVSPATPTVVDNGSPLAGTATFSPGTVTVAQAGAITMTTGAVLCAPLPSLGLSGTGTNGVLTVSPSPIAFGLVGCGSRGAAEVFRIRNDGNGAFDWSLALQSGNGFYVATPSSGTSLAPAAFVDVSIATSPIPATSAVTPNLYGDTLNVTTTINGAGNTRSVPITQTAQGVILTTSVTQISFGNVSTLAPMSAPPFTLTNSGNATGTVALSTTNATFSVSPASASLAGGGASITPTATFAPTAPGGQSGFLNFAVSGAAVCGGAQISLSGNGI